MLTQIFLSQAGIAVIACLSMHLLLAEGGLLSFGQAMHAGLGGYATVCLVRSRLFDWLWWTGTSSPIWLLAPLPLAGAAAGALAAVLTGYLATRRDGAAFSMITLGLAELLGSAALMWPEVFGGEGGLGVDPSARSQGHGGLGAELGWQMTLLVLAYLGVALWAVRALVRSPFGLLLHAVRDNPVRAAACGVDPRQVRWLACIIAGGLAGAAGSLAAMDFERVSAESLGAQRSATWLLFSVLGGGSGLAGPVIGGMLMAACGLALPSLTQAWPLYVGLVFMAVVVRAPAGLASLLPRGFVPSRRPRPDVLLLRLAALAALWPAGLLVEMAYQRQVDPGPQARLQWSGLDVPVHDTVTWLAVAGAAAAGLVLSWALWRIAARRVGQGLESAPGASS